MARRRKRLKTSPKPISRLAGSTLSWEARPRAEWAGRPGG
nr:E312 [uncultured bacterium]